MSGIVLPTDGFGIYDDISPDQGQSVWGPRLTKIAQGGFKVVVNYALLYGSTANMIAYINYAASLGLKVAIAMDLIWFVADLSAAFPTMYVEAGSPGITAANTFGTYVVNQCKGLAGTWGYYIADEPYNSNHTVIKSFHDAVAAADGTKPILIICTSDTTLGAGTFWNSDTTMYDCCSVGGDDTYPVGLAAKSITNFTIGSMSGYIQAFTASKGIQSAIVLQGFNFLSRGDPTLYDMQAMVGQATAHMQARLILWYSYQNIWGMPANIRDSAITADVNAATLWANLVRALGYSSRYVEEVLLDTPLRYHRIDDPACFAYSDCLVSTHAATINSTPTQGVASLLLGDIDTCWTFDGINTALTLDTTGFPTGAHPFTLEARIKASSYPGGGNYPGWCSIGGTGSSGFAEMFFNGDVGKFQFNVGDSSHSIVALAAPVGGATYHIIGAYDGTTAWLYVNGVPQGSLTTAVNIASGAAYIGRIHNGFNWTGQIDEYALYMAATNAARVTAHYNAGLAIGPSVRPLGNGRVARIG